MDGFRKGMAAARLLWWGPRRGPRRGHQSWQGKASEGTVGEMWSSILHLQPCYNIQFCLRACSAFLA